MKLIPVLTSALVVCAMVLVPAIGAEAKVVPTPKTIVHRPCPPIYER